MSMTSTAATVVEYGNLFVELRTDQTTMTLWMSTPKSKRRKRQEQTRSKPRSNRERMPSKPSAKKEQERKNFRKSNNVATNPDPNSNVCFVCHGREDYWNENQETHQDKKKWKQCNSCELWFCPLCRTQNHFNNCQQQPLTALVVQPSQPPVQATKKLAKRKAPSTSA